MTSRFASREFMKAIVDPMLIKRQRNDFICSERMRRLEAGKMRVELDEALAAERREMDSQVHFYLVVVLGRWYRRQRWCCVLMC
jgi:hypothetical protein